MDMWLSSSSSDNGSRFAKKSNDAYAAVAEVASRSRDMQEGNPQSPLWRIITIFNNCSVRIENSSTKVTVWHHEACKVMPNSYPEWRNFQITPNNQYRFYFLHIFPLTIAFKLNHALFYNLNATMSTFAVKKCLVWLISTMSMSKHFTEKDVKIDTKMSNNVLMSCTKVVLTPPQNWPQNVKKTSWCHARDPHTHTSNPQVRRHFLAPDSDAEIPLPSIQELWLVCNSRHDCFMMLLCLQNIYMQRYNVCCHDDLQWAAQWA